MDSIKSGRCTDILYAKTCATTKISTVAGYHVVLATLLFIINLYQLRTCTINVNIVWLVKETNPWSVASTMAVSSPGTPVVFSNCSKSIGDLRKISPVWLSIVILVCIHFSEKDLNE